MLPSLFLQHGGGGTVVARTETNRLKTENKLDKPLHSALNLNHTHFSKMQATTDQQQQPIAPLSFVRGATTPELSRLTFAQLVDQQADRYGMKEAILMGWSKAQITFQDLRDRTKELARGLLAMGIGKGDRVAVFSGDDERVIELFFAVGRIGAILVIFNKTYTLAECLRALEHTSMWSPLDSWK